MQIKKSPKADLERQKMMFLQIGLVAALAVMLVAFEWKDSEKALSTLGNLAVEDVMEEDVENTFREEKPPEPEPEPEPQQTVVEELNIVDNDVDVEDDFDFNSESDQNDKSNTSISDFSGDEVVEEPEPISFAVVEEKPTFPGGDAELMGFIAKNTKYPEIAKENGIQGRVFVQFVIASDGSVTKVTLARGVDPYLDEEAIRVVKLLPKWTPGKQRGKAVPVTFVVPINFKLY
ncbi:MAG: energy transducer TonB [Bacteroidales bacterium]|nr:energy transducer TonB [Bacteroidales bacterium]HOY38368.1 energy transducer TonB [Bacteroidales bacterium]HQP04431.1 energy transducer TonB [Bacteroidales bacterium]